MKTKTSGGGRIVKMLAAFLCMLMLCALFPLTAFAWPSGTPVSSWYGDSVVGSHGGTFQHPASWSVIVYNADGTQSSKTIRGGGDYRHFTLTDSSGETRWVYCVESGMNFDTSSGGYTVDSGYMGRLPGTAQQGIKLAALYGWKPGASSPAGNANDYYMATQVLVWEFQQQLRSDAHSRHGNGVADANQFYNIIAGTAAETCYNWILDRIASHNTVPSFTGTSSGGAPTHELKWDTVDKVYRLTLTDTNNLGIDLQVLSGHPNVTISRSGNRYTFTSTKMIMDPVTFTFRKNVPTGDAILIWGRPGYQTMMTGAEDPVVFYAKIKTETYGWARLIKTSEDGIVSGIKFNISGTDILGNKVNTDVTTGANGRVDAKLLPGTYLVKEYSIDRYVTPPPQYVTIESGQVSEVHFSNILKKFRVLLTKTDADTGFAQGDATFAGAVYGLYKGDQLVDTYTTDAQGQFLTRYYICDTDWTIKEISPSTGYLLDTTVHAVGADPRLYEVELNTTENHVTENPIYGYVRLIKHTDEWDEDIDPDEQTEDGNAGPYGASTGGTSSAFSLHENRGIVEQPEEGAVFEIFLRRAGSYAAARETERDILTTDADGFATSKKLPYGYYTVHQIAAGPAGENKAFIPDFTVFVSAHGYTYSYILNNDTIFGRLKVEKRNAETGAIIPIGGVGFQVRDLDTGEFVTQRVWYPNPIDIDTYYTSDEGWLMLPEALPKNTSGYELIEVQAPHGYVLDGNPIPFVIDGSEAVVTVVQHNMPQKGNITITKTGEVFASVEENDGFFQPIYEVMGLPGAVYEIIADEDIYTGDGTLRVAKDTVVDTLTTGPDATATSGLLYLGRYRLEERQAPTGMVLATEPIFVELTYQGQEVEVTHTELGIYDARQKVEIDLAKAMETDELFGVGLGDEYQNVTFGLYAAMDIVALDGSIIPAGGLIEVIGIEPVSEDGVLEENVPGDTAGGEGASDEGEATAKTWRLFAGAFATDLPFGSYYVQERTTDGQYITSDAQHLAVFAYAGQDVALVSITVNDGKAIENELIRGDVEGIKIGEEQRDKVNAANGGREDGLGHAAPNPGFAGEGTDGEDDSEVVGEEATNPEEDHRGLAGALIGLFHPDDEEMSEETAILLTTSAEDGSFSFRDIPFGHWVIREVAAPDSYILSPELHHVYIGVDGQLISIRMENWKIRGNVQLVKVDAAAPWVKLPGAVFELYEDTNANGEFDEEDALLGELEEVDGGIHEWRGLTCSGYFVLEKTPPTGFLADETPHYFEIVEDGVTIIIENGEKGMHFGNVADGGTARIVKDSEDGRRYGFTFKIEGEGYSETLTTGADGIIAVGLKPGTYTITEVKDEVSQGYILPAPATVAIKQGETAVIQFFNALPDEPEVPTTPETPPTPTTPTTPTTPNKPVPQTGDNYMVFVWAICVGAALLAGIVSLMLYRRWASAHTRRRTFAAIAVVLCLALAITGGGLIVGEYMQYKKGADSYAEILLAAGGESTDGSISAGVGAPSTPPIDFGALSTINPDVVAWLVCEGTEINYPVVKGADNTQYLDTMFDGGKGKAGCLFMDYENSRGFTDQNTVIYGHNLLDGSMLSGIIQYGEVGYYDVYPTMTLHTPEGSFTVELFSGYTAHTSEDAWLLSWESETDFTAWLEQARGRSAFDSEVEVAPGDRVLTLSTCTNGGRDRFVLHGRLVAET